MLLTNIWVFINIVLYFAIGLCTLCNYIFISNAVNFQLLTNSAIAEFKAMYGGLQISLAVIMFLLYKTQQTNYAIAFIGLIYLGFGSGRLLGIIFNGAFDQKTLIYISIEIISVVLSYYLYVNNPK